jgi:hypothetical protein
MPAHGQEERNGRRVRGPAARVTPRQRGAMGMSRVSGQSEPLCVMQMRHSSVFIFASAAMNTIRSMVQGACRGNRWRRSSATSRGRHPLPTGNSENNGGDVKRAGASAGTREHDRSISCQPDTMVPALGLVGGTPGWAVRRIIPRRSPPASHASHDCAVQSPAPRPALFISIQLVRHSLTFLRGVKITNCPDSLWTNLCIIKPEKRYTTAFCVSPVRHKTALCLIPVRW